MPKHAARHGQGKYWLSQAVGTDIAKDEGRQYSLPTTYGVVGRNPSPPSPLLSRVASVAAPRLYFLSCRLRMRMPLTGIQIIVPMMLAQVFFLWQRLVPESRVFREEETALAVCAIVEGKGKGPSNA